MANTTFSGPVRSKNGFQNIVENSSGSVTNTMTFQQHTVTVTVANGATVGTESSISMPVNFIPMGAVIAVTTAASNSVTINDIGSDADPDGFIDGISAAANSTRFK